MAQLLCSHPIDFRQTKLPSMRKTVLAIASFLMSLLVLHGEVLTGKVVRISDGDTITVLNQYKEQYKVRLYGIDAPESKQAFGNVSQQHLGTLLKGGNVKVEWKTKDKYGRILGTVYVNDLNINLKMIQDGMAWHYKRFDSTKSFADAETSAKEKKLGLWKDPNAIPPWEFRKNKKN